MTDRQRSWADHTRSFNRTQTAFGPVQVLARPGATSFEPGKAFRPGRILGRPHADLRSGGTSVADARQSATFRSIAVRLSGPAAPRKRRTAVLARPDEDLCTTIMSTGMRNKPTLAGNNRMYGIARRAAPVFLQRIQGGFPGGG